MDFSEWRTPEVNKSSSCRTISISCFQVTVPTDTFLTWSLGFSIYLRQFDIASFTDISTWQAIIFNAIDDRFIVNAAKQTLLRLTLAKTTTTKPKQNQNPVCPRKMGHRYLLILQKETWSDETIFIRLIKTWNLLALFWWSVQWLILHNIKPPLHSPGVWWVWESEGKAYKQADIQWLRT